MLNSLKSQLPTAIFLFVIYFIIIKTPFLIAPTLLPIAKAHNLWTSFGIFFNQYKLFNSFIGIICILIQSLWFNYLFHKADFHETNTMIPAFYYVLVSSLFQEFNQLSIYILINFILLFFVQIALSINTQESAKAGSFNFGLVAASLVLLNIHFIVFLPFVFLILYVLRPFRFQEYVLLAFGILFVFYMTISISYLTNLSIDLSFISLNSFNFFLFKRDSLSLVLLIMTSIYLLFSFVSLRGIMYSTGFKRRKNVNMLVFLFVGLIVTIILSRDLDETTLSILIIPVSIFFALFMLRIRKKRLGEILNAIFITVTIVTNIVRIFK